MGRMSSKQEMLRIKCGFTGQRLAAYPFYVIEKLLGDPATDDLVVHSMGYFPNAACHYVDRPTGCGEYILIYCTKGKGWYVIDGVKYEVSENQYFILPSEKPHSYGCGEKDAWYIYWVHFKGRKADRLFQNVRGLNTFKVTRDSRMEERISLFEELLAVMEGGASILSADYVNLGFQRLISTFCYPEVYRKARFPGKSVANSRFISHATHYLDENLDKAVTLEGMALFFGCSKSYIYRSFVKETGYAPLDYFSRMKVRRACELLENTSLRINHIALRLGYSDPYYFSRMFKKITGQPPAVYRKSRTRYV